MDGTEHLTPSEAELVHQAMSFLGRELGLDFVVVVGCRKGVVTALTGCRPGAQRQVEKVKTMLRKGFHALGVPTSSLNDPRGERN